MREYLIGLDVGGTKCATLLGRRTRSGVEILERVAFATRELANPDGVLGRFCADAQQLLKQRNITAANVGGIGISCGGPLDSRTGLVLGPPNLPGWERVPIVAYFEKTLGIAARLQNDANACALAEWKWGAGRGLQNVVFLTFGTGMGAGLILDGRLYSGTNDNAGEVGHVRLEPDGPVGYGKPGSFEGFCSGGGIAKLAQQLIRAEYAHGGRVNFCPESSIGGITARDVCEAARAGDQTALKIIDTSARQLGRGLALLIDILNPEAIVIGSIFTRQRELFWPAVQDVIQAEALPLSAGCCKILPAQLDERIGDYAALSVAASIEDDATCH